MASDCASPRESRSHYRAFCEKYPEIPLFSQAWWLDAVAPGIWDARICQAKGIEASLPYVSSTKLGLRISAQPPLTQSLGPWLSPMDSRAKESNWMGVQKEAAERLIEQLPDFHVFMQNWDPSQTNWLPFYWAGFEQTTRYTYQLPDISDLDNIWSGFRGSVRTAIRKAEQGRDPVRVVELDDAGALIALNREGLRRRGASVPYSDNTVEAVFAAVRERGQGVLLGAIDDRANLQGAVFVVWDLHRAYYLMAATSEEGRRSGANVLLVWEAIKRAQERVRCFDFEGSMIESIERFVRTFGPVQVPYFRVSRYSHRALHAASVLRESKRG